MSLQKRYRTPEQQARIDAVLIPEEEPMADEMPNQAQMNLEILKTLQAIQASASGGSDVTEALKQITETLAGVANRSRPENPQHNGISAYSYPEGDYKRPKPPLKCDMYWVGYPLTLETLTPIEIDTLNTLTPGNYRVTKSNGIEIPFTVEGKTKMNGNLESLSVQFPCKGEQSTDHGSMVSYIRQAMGEKIPNLDQLMAELDKVKQQLAAKETVVV